jgi:hypothetical protein
LGWSPDGVDNAVWIKILIIRRLVLIIMDSYGCCKRMIRNNDVCMATMANTKRGAAI